MRRYCERSDKLKCFVGAVCTLEQIGGMSASAATPQTNRWCSFLRSDIALIGEVAYRGVLGVMAITTVRLCVASKTAAAKIPTISSTGEAPVMGVVGGRVGGGPRGGPMRVL